ARAVSVQDADSTARTTSAKVLFADGTPAAGSTAQADALGRPVRQTSGEVTAVPSYGTGGIPQSTVLTPAAPDTYPGQEFTAALTHDLAGHQTSKTLTQGGDGTDTRTGMRSTYDAAGRLASQTDQLGNTTAYTYNSDGQIAEAVVETKDG
uniref:RHS repeat domain-containing protein n=1 Tax=Streptomyces sp. NRRL F-2664 TaxID=1463842 RepID=UPI0005B89996